MEELFFYYIIIFIIIYNYIILYLLKIMLWNKEDKIVMIR